MFIEKTLLQETRRSKNIIDEINKNAQILIKICATQKLLYLFENSYDLNRNDLFANSYDLNGKDLFENSYDLNVKDYSVTITSSSEMFESSLSS